ncbi:secretion protein HlyD family protein [Methylocella silvestris BL2]|uniref:Secretion protein HlyD family protein n=1 Tax=Methylocella silvestris (strain DSM 15510 / CIP 108128 / LMG 27833 / NCIMB 13906 / BL2) TaxID=395965 RepID=B8EKJ2_METSB|nr:HlyD family secretion protein [Methylocella silvestris]ACK51362.1 secretion protein HlyD family protein [Methylocella silvestris BL2]
MDQRADHDDLGETAEKPQEPAGPHEDEARPQEAAEAAVEAEEASQEPVAPPKKKRSLLRIGLLIFAALIAGGGYLYLSTRDIQSTDDAFTDGRAVTIAPQVSGLVVSLDVTDNQFVRKGDAMIHIDPRRYLQDRDSAKGALEIARAQLEGLKLGVEIARKNFPAQLEQAKAQLASAQAAAAKADADYQRQKSLPKQATTQQEVDAATASLRQAQAQVMLAQAQLDAATPVPQRIGQADADVGRLTGQVEQAQAQLDQANLNLEWTVVRAPQDGWITKRNVEVGSYVTPGQSIFSIVSPDVWVTANFKETQLDRIRPGQEVDIEIDAYPQLKLKGHVDSIQLGTGSKFTAFPPENATGNFVKIVQRVPVKIVIDSGLDPALPLPLGVSAVPTVRLK